MSRSLNKRIDEIEKGFKANSGSQFKTPSFLKGAKVSHEGTGKVTGIKFITPKDDEK